MFELPDMPGLRVCMERAFCIWILPKELASPSTTIAVVRIFVALTYPFYTLILSSQDTSQTLQFSITVIFIMWEPRLHLLALT